jgi:hypothetical protein
MTFFFSSSLASFSVIAPDASKVSCANRGGIRDFDIDGRIMQELLRRNVKPTFRLYSNISRYDLLTVTRISVVGIFLSTISFNKYVHTQKFVIDIQTVTVQLSTVGISSIIKIQRRSPGKYHAFTTPERYQLYA